MILLPFFFLLLISLSLWHSQVTRKYNEKVIFKSDKIRLACNKRSKHCYSGVPREIDWSNAVAIIQTYNKRALNAVLKSIFRIGVARLGKGIDILLATNKDDS